jgi:hypothetical protein
VHGAIFVSYRRQDTPGHVGRLVQDLSRSFGGSSVFLDLTHLEPGASFEESLRVALATCKVMLVMMGPRWLKGRGARRNGDLDNPEDWVRKELLAARKRRISIIPVRFEGASVMEELEVPGDLRWFLKLQAHAMSERHWVADVESLVAAIERKTSLRRRRTAQPAASKQPAPIVGARRKALAGVWSGQGRQEKLSDWPAFTSKVDVKLRVTGAAIEGAGAFRFKEYNIRFKLTGTFSHDRFLKLDYNNIDDDAIQFGCFMAELSADGKTLSGHYVGYGAVSEDIVRGAITISKGAPRRR